MLTGYDGRTFPYDTIGNLTSDGERTYTWKHGRQLATLSDGTTTWTYTYNADGLRTRKTDGTTTYNYVYNGGQLTQMTVGADTLYFSYDATGRPMTVTHNGTVYHYVLSLQGDVLLILDSNGGTAASYQYDAWGYVESCTGTMANTLGSLNPLRYRSYVYDQETGLYYLQSRYYNPERGRFLNADAFVSTGQGFVGNNMFAYCNNNPVNNVDSLGLWTISISGTLSGVFGLGISLSFGFAFDVHGNFDLQYSYAIPGVDDTVMVGGVGAGAGIAVQYTKADTVYNLYGSATYVGASVGPSWYVGGDIVSFSDASDPEMTTDGFQLVAGVGVGVDVHVTESYTRSVFQTNKSAHCSSAGGSRNRAMRVFMLY